MSTDANNVNNETGKVEEVTDTPKVEEVLETSTGNDSVEHWRSVAQLWEKRAKSNLTKVSETETQYKTLEERIQEMETENLNLKRSSIASKYNLPEVVAQRLQGKTAEELEADAQTFSEILGSISSKPKETKKELNLKLQGKETDQKVSSKVSSKEEFLAAIKRNS